MAFPRIMRLTALILVPALLSNSPALAQSGPMKPVMVKQRLEKRGVGHGVLITLIDKTKLKGLILSIGQDSCEIKPNGQSQPQTVAYEQVRGVHSYVVSTGEKVGVTLGIVVLVLVILGTSSKW